MRTILLLAASAIALGGCANNVIAPDYTSTDPNLLVGGTRPEDSGPTRERAGSFCLEVTEKWQNGGRTPDGKTLWVRDTYRKAVPCT